jgi:hypothetical protein
MIRLVAYDNNDTPVELDVFGNESVPLTLNVDDLRDIGSKNGGYSKDFDLPYTKVNNKFFNHIYDLQVDSNYNPFTNSKAELYINDNLVFSGGLYLVEFVNKEKEKSYKVNLFSNTVRLLDALGEATLNDLDYTDLNHTFTEQNVIDSWGNTGVTLTAGGTSTDVLYPLTQTKGILTTNTGLRIISSRNYTPFVRLKYILDKIFEYVGFSYDSDFFSTDAFTDVFMDTGLADFSSNATFDVARAYTGIPYADVNWQSGSDDFDIIGAVEDTQVSVTSNNTYQSATGGADSSHKVGTATNLWIPYTKVISSAATFNGVDQESGYGNLQDPNNLYNNGIITAPVDNFEFWLLARYCVYGAVGTQVKLTANITSGSSTNSYVLADVTITNTVYYYGLSNNFAILEFFGAQTLALQNDTLSLVLEASDDAYLMPYGALWTSAPNYYPAGGIPNSSYLKFYDGIHQTLQPTEVIVAPYGQNSSIDDRIKNNHTEVKLKDIFSDITKLFNLYVDVTDNDRKLKIEPYADYVAAGTVLDWTNKADLNEIVSIYSDLPSKIEFKYNNDEDDYALNQYKKTTQEDYGSFILNLSTDKLQEEEIALEVFSATAVVHYSASHPYSSVVQRDEAGVWERLKNKPRLVYKNHTPEVTATDDLFDIVDHTEYHMASHYNNKPSDINANTLDLNFGYTYPVSAPNTLNTIKNLFNTYYYRYILERYTQDRTFVKINIKLSAEDIASFRFSDKIRIQNQTYLVNKIEYNAGEFGISKVELVKI